MHFKLKSIAEMETDLLTNTVFLNKLKDTLKALKASDDFKNKQKSVWNNVFLICKSIYIRKVY